jgi:Mrp family chromosome partitioning ATPase
MIDLTVQEQREAIAATQVLIAARKKKMSDRKKSASRALTDWSVFPATGRTLRIAPHTTRSRDAPRPAPRAGVKERSELQGDPTESRIGDRLTSVFCIESAQPSILVAAAAPGGRAGPRTHIATVVGEAGIGKTRLVSALAADALTHGCQVLMGRRHESDSILPFAPWVDACRGGGLGAASASE